MPVGGIDDLVRDAPGPSGPDEPACVHSGPLQLVNGIADRRGDFARLVNVPREATHEIALTH